jgi:CBS domain-containing protein
MSHCWQKTLISESSTIKQALEIINSEALRVAVVVDQDKKLLGMITDGDIRRGLLNDLVLTDSVAKVMNSEPITAKQGASKEHLVELMEKSKFYRFHYLTKTTKS